MTCCADDIAKIGFICHHPQAAELDLDSWVKVSVKVKPEYSHRQQTKVPMLWADKIEQAEAPAEEIVYFS